MDARLLTSYERAGESGESHQQVEIIHESLLQAWPRLVRWQTQDADGAQLRDQLRQAAQLWQDRGKADDLLWSGTAYQDFALWRQRYPAPLTATEDAFAPAMTAQATRRRRRRRAAVAALVGVAATVAITTSVLWQRADASRRKAEAETRQREAGELLALGRLRLDDTRRPPSRTPSRAWSAPTTPPPAALPWKPSGGDRRRTSWRTPCPRCPLEPRRPLAGAGRKRWPRRPRP